MSPDRRDRVSELYHEASGRPPEKCDAFLTEACGEDEALRAEVEPLLRFEGATSPFLEKPAASFATRTKGIVHRDLKPPNIVLQSVVNAAGVPSGDVRAKVLDFGLAKTMPSPRAVT